MRDGGWPVTVKDGEAGPPDLVSHLLLPRRLPLLPVCLCVCFASARKLRDHEQNVLSKEIFINCFTRRQLKL